MSKEEIIIENIAITLERKKIKHMYLRITPKGEVKISAPQHLKDIEIINFVKSKKEWIIKKQSILLKNNVPLKYINREKHMLWGEEYELQLVLKNKLKSPIADQNTNIIYLPVPLKSKTETRKKILMEFYRQELKKEIPRILEKCIEIVGKSPNEVKIRNMKNWGNCRYHDKRITLNLKLAMKDKKCLEYVIIHELTHLIEFNHGKNFKKLMDEFMPNWREIKEKLNK